MKFEIWGMSGTLVTEYETQATFAEARLWHWLDAFDASCNRFRPDSELSELNRHGHVALSPTLELALLAALDSFEATGGLCDPTVLPALLALGYDADFATVAQRNDLKAGVPLPSRGSGAITLDLAQRRVTLEPGCQLDLGASAKALVVDLVARDLAPSGGVLVELGGDVAVTARRSGVPWPIGVSDTLKITGVKPTVGVTEGGVATSSTLERSWVVEGRRVHHVLDPRTGASASGTYVTATVSAQSCLRANAFATAALIWGEDAGYYLAQSGCAARLIRADGSLEFVGGWPEDVVAA